jgi:heat shock protein HslJ
MSDCLRRGSVGLVGIVLIAGFLTSCDGDGDVSGHWRLEEASSAERDLGSLQQVETTPNILMDEGEIYGNAGCNDFHGEYEVRGFSIITFVDVWMELKGCDPVSNAYDRLFGQIFVSEVEVQTGSDWMTWSADGYELRFVRSSAETD